MPKSSPPKKKRHPQIALVCGEAFQRLAKEFIPRIGEIEEGALGDMSKEVGDLVACATNLAFAIELYLKGLLTHLDLPITQNHDLRNLYDQIPQAVRAIIEEVYDSFWPKQLKPGRRTSFTLAKGPREEPLWDDHTKTSPALPDLLARSRDSFQSWRYVFEYAQPKESPYQFHKFEYGLLWCAAEAFRIELIVRLQDTGDAPAPHLLEDES